jgi:myo-inositol-1(or 4)-monophosphatase
VTDLEIAEQAARAAGMFLLEAFGTRVEISHKTTHTDPVSEADHRAEEIILGILPAADAVLTEEEGSRDGTTGRRWIVDPLDGTVNFLYGYPQWCVSIALEDRVGVVYDPLRDELWAAEAGGTATRNGEPVAASEKAELGRTLVATGFGYDTEVRVRQAEIVARVLPAVRDIRRGGSAALDMAWAADTRHDAYFEFGVKAWDVAAGRIICEAAGLVVRELPADGDLPAGILVAPAAVVDELQSLL